jgi:hypothetical protein
MVVEVDARVDGSKSAPRALSSGVPQVCIPSPVCFSMFINDLCTCIRFSEFFISILMICRFICLDIGKIWLRFLDGRLIMGCNLTPASRRRF